MKTIGNVQRTPARLRNGLGDRGSRVRFPASYPMGTSGSLPEVKRLGPEADY